MIDDIQELLHREPFRSFTIITTSGDELAVHSPKQVKVPIHGESVHFEARDYTMHVIAARHIVKLTFRTGAS